MNQILILLSLAVLTLAHAENRIVGGQDANPGQFKYIASIRHSSNNSHFCGAAIVTPSTLVTAAHCMSLNFRTFDVVVGAVSLDDAEAPRHKIQRFIRHPFFDGATFENDIAVINLKEPIEFNDSIGPVALPSATPKEGDELVISGWGFTSYPGDTSNNLQWFNTLVYGRDLCRKWTSELIGKVCTLTERGQGICSGDSGGPLVNGENELVGVASSAFLCARGLPDLFTDVNYFKDWVLKYVK